MFADFIKKFRGLIKFNEIEFCWRPIFESLIIHRPSQGHVRSHKNVMSDRFSRFGVYWIQTNKQTPRQAKYAYR